jgi:tetratricopeptide (TPR) repeat protein
VAISCERGANKKIVARTNIDSLLVKGEENYNNPEIGEKILDSAYSLIPQNKNDSLIRYFYRRGTIAYYNMSLYDKSLASSKKVYQLGKEAKDTLSMAKAMHFTAASFYGKLENDSAFFYYRQAEDIYASLGDSRSTGEIVLYKAYIYYDIGEFVLSESEAFRALKFLLEENKPTTSSSKVSYSYRTIRPFSPYCCATITIQPSLTWGNIGLRHRCTSTKEKRLAICSRSTSA